MADVFTSRINCGISPWIGQIHRIISRVSIPIRPNPRLGHFKPVGLDEPPKFRVVVARVEVLQACVLVIALADESLGLGSKRRVNVIIHRFAKWQIDGAFGAKSCSVSDYPYGIQLIAVQIGIDLFGDT